MKPDIVVRPCAPSDWTQLAPLLLDVHRHQQYPYLLSHVSYEWLHDTDSCWVATVDGHVQAHIAVRAGAGAFSGWLEISRFFVGRGARGLGIASQLLNEVDSFAADVDKKLFLKVLDTDQAAAQLYERRGWRNVSSGTTNIGDVRDVPLTTMVHPSVSFG